MKEQVKKLNDISVPAMYLGNKDDVTYDKIIAHKRKFGSLAQAFQDGLML